ncbi:MAG: glycosyltransferase family 4 protein [Verrucomicrobia bacterium]|nr:glycosyltransferase family 4 protein [Verrucomicrobiota bacterium]
MKLALIRRSFSAVGGAELYVQRLLRALADRGHELHLFAEAWGDPPQGVEVHTVQASGNRAVRPLDFARQTLKAVQAQTFDCVFSFERTLRQDVMRAGDGVHASWLEARRRFAPWWRKPFTGRGQFHTTQLMLERETFKPENTRHIIANSEMVRQDIIKRFNYPGDRIHLVRNGVNVDRFQGGDREKTRARFGFKPEDLVLLFVGSGWERKGLRYAMRVLDEIAIRQGVEILAGEWKGEAAPAKARKLAATKLLVVGKGRKPWPCSNDAVFAGAMGDVENAYAAADVFVFLPIYEPSSNVVFEALAAGLPVVTSRQNGASELVQHRVTGSVLDDPSNIRQAADEVVFWVSQRFQMRLADISTLRLERNVEETIAVLELAAAEKRRSSA